MSTQVVIALGSNVGDSLRNLQDAFQSLDKVVQTTAKSSVYRTAPMYVEDQPEFLNAAIVAKCDVGPRALLGELKRIEHEVGRHERERYGPREIDLDLIAFGSLAYSFSGGDKDLVVPHPKTQERRFVLAPLAEVAPDFVLVGIGRACDLLAQTNEQADTVERLDHAQL